MKKVLLFGVLALLVLSAVYFLFSGNGKNGQMWKLVKVGQGDIAEKALAVGTIEPEKEIKVKSTISGIVSEVYFKVGDLVEKGRPLFKISPNPTPLEYVETRRSMEMAKVSLDKIQSERQRKLALYKESLISPQEMEGVESQYSETELRYRITREKFELMEKGRIQMANKAIDSVITSPISGIVLQQIVFQGDPVVPLTTYQPGTELCSMADMARLLFKGTVDEIDVGKLETGMITSIQVGALLDTAIEGRLQRIHPKAKKEGNATMFDIEIAIVKVAGKTLRAGYSATAYVKVQEKKGVLIVPERVVLFEGDKRFVEVPQGKEAVKREIRTGLSDGLNIEIVSGLKQGEQVIERPPKEIE